MKDPDITVRNIEKTHVWLDELAEELGTDDRQQAYRVLRSFLLGMLPEGCGWWWRAEKPSRA